MSYLATARRRTALALLTATRTNVCTIAFRNRGLLWLAAVVTTVSPASGQFVQQGPKLVGTGAVGTALQGGAVATSRDGDTVLVGGQGDSSERGAAWVYTRAGGVWRQQAKLVATGSVGRSGVGASVALSGDGNTALLGGPYDSAETGAVWVFTRSGAAWFQQGSKLVGNDVSGPARFGVSVSLSDDGNTAIIGGLADNGGPGGGAGAAWVYTRSSGTWTQHQPKLVGTGAVGGALQGTAVAISADGTTALVGGFMDNEGAGAAWAFTRSGDKWIQQGGKLVGTGAAGEYSSQGLAVSLSADGNTAVIGGPTDNRYVGAAWVFTRSSGVWTQQGGKLVGTGASGNAYQGTAVSLSADGNIAIVGGGEDTPNPPRPTGATWVFQRAGNSWNQQGGKLTGSGSVGLCKQGGSVALSGDAKTAVAGGPYDDDGVGAAWVFSASPSDSPAITGVVNAASFIPSTISSGSWVTIFGTGLATAGHSRQWNSTDIIDDVLPVSLDGTSVTMNGKPAPIAFVQSTQLNVLVPDIADAGPVQVIVKAPAGTTAPITVNHATFAPGLFAATPPYLVAQHADGSLVSPAAPARPGEVIVLWGTGFGPSQPAVPSGRAFTGAAPIANTVTARIGLVPAAVEFAGIVTAGLVQINLSVPFGLDSGDLGVVATVGGVSSQTVANLIPVGN